MLTRISLVQPTSEQDARELAEVLGSGGLKTKGSSNPQAGAGVLRAGPGGLRRGLV